MLIKISKIWLIKKQTLVYITTINKHPKIKREKVPKNNYKYKLTFKGILKYLGEIFLLNMLAKNR